MKIKVTDAILDYENKPIKERDSDGKEIGDLTWRTVIDNALNSLGREEQPLASEQRTHAYQITMKIYAVDELDLTEKERVFVIDRIGKVYPSPLINGRAEEIFLEKKEEEKNEEEEK